MKQKFLAAVAVAVLAFGMIACDAEQTGPSELEPTLTITPTVTPLPESTLATGQTETQKPESTEEVFNVPEELVGKKGVEGNICYIITEEGVSITGMEDKSATELYIPSEICGCPVVEIRVMAFMGCSNLKKVEIADGVKSIGSLAFNACTNLEELIIPQSVEEVDNGAFNDTAWLATKKKNDNLIIAGRVVLDGKECEGTVVLPDYVVRIAGGAFYGAALTEIVLPEGLKYIDSCAFCECKNLMEISIPDSVTCIESLAFQDCESLGTINLPEHITNLGGLVFDGTPWLKSKIVESEDGYVIINTTLQNTSKVKGNAVIPEGVTSIEYAFYRNQHVTAVTVPGTVKEVDTFSFYDCSAIKTVTFLEGVESIDTLAFKNCAALEKVSIPESVTYISAKAFQDCALDNITIACSSENPVISTLQNMGLTKFVEYNASETTMEGVTSASQTPRPTPVLKEGDPVWLSGEFTYKGGHFKVGYSLGSDLGNIGYLGSVDKEAIAPYERSGTSRISITYDYIMGYGFLNLSEEKTNLDGCVVNYLSLNVKNALMEDRADKLDLYGLSWGATLSEVEKVFGKEYENDKDEYIYKTEEGASLRLQIDEELGLYEFAFYMSKEVLTK